MANNGRRFIGAFAAFVLQTLLVAGSVQAQPISFMAPSDFGTGSSPYSVAVGDFNGDRILDLAVANANSNNVSVLINNTP